MPAKRKRVNTESKSEDPERSPTPTSISSSKKRKKELQYDPVSSLLTFCIYLHSNIHQLPFISSVHLSFILYFVCISL